MDWYLITKFLHVVFAIIWLGGALVMVILGTAAARARNDEQLVSVVRQVAWCADRVYVPASIMTLIFGLLTTWLGGLWSELWVILGLAGIVATIFLGIVVLSPRAKKVESEHVAGGATPQAIATSREIVTIARFDMVLLFTVVADMVLKPTPADWVTLVVMALVILGAAVLFLRPLLSPPRPAAA
jgi:uncharacterized membrane protein